MANWLLVVDKNAARRQRLIESIQGQLHPFEGLDERSLDGANWTVAWAAGSRAPIKVCETEMKTAVLWGAALTADGIRPTERALVGPWDKDMLPQWDGYYSVCNISADGNRVFVGVDRLGLFPVYSWSNGEDVCLIGSSPELFRRHPEFSPELDYKGLAGVLLTNGLVGRTTLCKGVSRLTPGRQLCVENFAVSEVGDLEIERVEEINDIPFRGHLKQLDAVLRDTINRHTGEYEEVQLMLSGGLDARGLAGYLAGSPTKITAITFGNESDNEVYCARKVAALTCNAHDVVPIDENAGDSNRLARWEHLSAGFCNMYEWSLEFHEGLKKKATPVVVGHLVDRVLGGIHIGYSFDSDSGRIDYEKGLAALTDWGLAPEQVEAMLPKSEAAVVAEVLSELKERYESLSGADHQRAWLFELMHRQRYHVGAVLWATSFAAWPIVPVLDRKLLACCYAMPSATLAERRAQEALQVRYFPELAACPLDRNSMNNFPLAPSVRDHIARSIGYRTKPIKRAVFRWLGVKAPDPVFYRRIYDFESPRWRDIRELAESNRALLHQYLNSQEVDAVWPEGHVKTNFDNAIKDPNPARLLLGLSMVFNILESD